MDYDKERYVEVSTATRLICSWLIFLVGNISALAADPTTFFATTAPDLSALPPEGIFPHGQKFGYGLYTVQGQSDFDPTKTNMERVAENGFTLAGPYYQYAWKDFKNIHAAGQHGLKFTYQIRPHEDLFGLDFQERGAAMAKLSDEQISASARTQVESILADPVARGTVARWSLGLEEVRYWYPQEMNYLSVVRDTIRQVEREHNLAHMPFWMYESNNRNSFALQQTGVHQDIVSKGIYITNRSPRGEQRSGFAIWSFDQITDAASHLENVPQAVFELSQDFNNPSTETAAEIRRVIRHDTYLGLVKGMQSMNVWSMYENRPNLTTHEEQFQAYSSVAKDLAGELNLQRVFLFGERKNDLEIEVEEGPKTIKYEHDDGSVHEYKSLHFLNAAIDDSRYLVIVNSVESPLEVSIDGLPGNFKLEDLFGGQITPYVDATRLTVSLSPLEVRAWQLKALPSVGASLKKAPEPSTLMLLSIVFLALAATSRRR